MGAPVVEEVLYRGLAVGVLIRWCGWNWLAACLWPAVFFGLAHIWQGESLGETAAVVGITAFGAVLFGWLYVRWGFSLWPPILLHIGMNMQWLVFDLGETAIGGVTGNVLRFGVVALAVGATFWLTRAMPQKTA
ncbi:MAG: CPBP family intramembrane metalloprotease [Micropepsaceae bacterium]